MMTPRRFRWHRLTSVLRFDPTGTVEIVVGLCFVLVPGIFLAVEQSELPNSTFSYFMYLGFSESGMGLWAMAFGLVQCWAAATNWYSLRAWIATGMAASLTAVVTAYWSSGYRGRGVVPLMLGTILAEMFIAWRCWHERPDPVRKVGTRRDVSVQ